MYGHPEGNILRTTQIASAWAIPADVQARGYRATFEIRARYRTGRNHRPISARLITVVQRPMYGHHDGNQPAYNLRWPGCALAIRVQADI
jgi:hypothetical protein